MGNQKTRESAERLTSWNRGSEEESVIDFILRYTLLLCPSQNPSDATQNLTLSSSSHSHPPSSVKLSVEWRKLVEVPGELFDYRYLENLSLAFNKICELPNSFRRFGRLTELCLASNQLTSFPTVLYSLTQLRILSLGGNSIQSLPDAMFVELGIYHDQSSLQCGSARTNFKYFPFVTSGPATAATGRERAYGGVSVFFQTNKSQRSIVIEQQNRRTSA